MSTDGKTTGINRRVRFSWPGANPGDPPNEGTGLVISERADDIEGVPHVLVAVDPTPPEARHFVIRCAMTWLTFI